MLDTSYDPAAKPIGNSDRIHKVVFSEDNKYLLVVIKVKNHKDTWDVSSRAFYLPGISWSFTKKLKGDPATLLPEVNQLIKKANDKLLLQEHKTISHLRIFCKDNSLMNHEYFGSEAASVSQALHKWCMQ